jgi:hypothetical protein
MKIVDFKQEHLRSLKVKEVHTGEVPSTVMTEAVTIMDEEKPVAVFGAFCFVPGVYHIWGLVSDDVHSKPIQFFKIAKDLLKLYEYKIKPRRLQIDIKVGYPYLQKWAIALGFECEGIMKKFGATGEDFYLYGKAN